MATRQFLRKYLTGAWLQWLLILGAILSVALIVLDLNKTGSLADRLRGSQISELLLVFVLAVEGIVAFRELQRMKEDRYHDNIVAIIERTAEHVWQVQGNNDLKIAVATNLKLSVPEDAKQNGEYWAARIIHLSHINLLWQVWELTHEKDGALPAQMGGWTKFKAKVSGDLAKEADHNGTPYQKAAADIMDGMTGTSQYEVMSPGFMCWFFSSGPSCRQKIDK